MAKKPMNEEQEKLCVAAAVQWMQETGFKHPAVALKVLLSFAKICPKPKSGISSITLSFGEQEATINSSTRRLVDMKIHGLKLLLAGKYKVKA